MTDLADDCVQYDITNRCTCSSSFASSLLKLASLEHNAPFINHTLNFPSLSITFPGKGVDHVMGTLVCKYLEKLFSHLYIYRRENSVPHTICSLYYTGK